LAVTQQKLCTLIALRAQKQMLVLKPEPLSCGVRSNQQKAPEHILSLKRLQTR
jgi:hypothetical protein